MKRKFMSSILLLGSMWVMLTSSVPVDITKNDKPVSKEEKIKLMVDEAMKDEKKLTKEELYKLATDVKGKKLNFAEKMALKAFNKKAHSSDEAKQFAGGGKSQLAALLLVIFVGGIGIHRFYLGYTAIGIIQLLTLGGLGIWTLIDLIRIITGDLKPKDGDYEKTL
jgi:hypothetical protein